MSEPGPSFTAIVESAARAAATLVGDAAQWWTVPSTSLYQPAVLGAQNALRPLLLTVLGASILVQTVRIIALRRGEPLLAVAGGLVRFGAASAIGVTVLQAALWAGDVSARRLLGESASTFGTTMREALTSRGDGLAEPFLLLLLSVVVLLLAAAQWMAMALRQVGLLAVAAMMPLAAAGSLTAATRGWLSRLVPWALALVVYKPGAALVHALGQQYLTGGGLGGGAGGPGGGSVATVLAGIVVLALGVAMLPVSLRLLSWSSVRVGASGVPGESMVGALGAVSLTGRGATSPSVRLATFMESAGPGTAPSASGARPASPAPAATDAVEHTRGAAGAPDLEPAPERSLLAPALTRPIPPLPTPPFGGLRR